jgi:hypothetical protein
MITIWKYPLAITEEQTLKIPLGYKPLHVGLDPAGVPCLWCKVNTESEPCPAAVFVVGTGGDADFDYNERYVGSFVDGSFVWHVFA